MKTIPSMPGWVTKYKWAGAALAGYAGFVVLLCACGVVAALLVQPTQALRTTEAVGVAQMPLGRTVTPLPALAEQVTSTSGVALPSPTATSVLLPTATNTPAVTVVIIGVNKVSEYVDIQNNGSLPVDLSGWVLVSEKGDQRCPLRGVLSPGALLRIWSRSSSSDFSCHFPTNIWNNDGVDPAVLYDPQGDEVSRYPQ